MSNVSTFEKKIPSGELFGHPRGLFTLFFTEMWERFAYYGMRALLVLYLVSAVGLDRAGALEIYAIFTGLVYLTPLAGGAIADKILGQRKAIIVGGLLMALGLFAIASGEALLNVGLGLLIVGNGFFKPNISTIVGALYEQNDPRKDGGFTIFYMGINLGALFSPLVCGTLGEKISWGWGFGAAGIGMVAGLIIFLFNSKSLGNLGFPPSSGDRQFSLTTKDWSHILIWAAATAAVTYGVIILWSSLGEEVTGYIKMIGAVLGVIALVFIIANNTKGGDEWSRVGVIFILAFFNIFFWAGFEQAGGTFNLFADGRTDRVIGFLNWEIPTTYFQSINPVFILALAPAFDMLWQNLAKTKFNPSTPVKFAFGLILLGVGFFVMNIADSRAVDGNLVSPLWLVTVYLFHTMGELCLSPIGLSMITKLSPTKITAVMMGLWFGSIALAQYMAGILESLLHNYLPDTPLFLFLTMTSVTGGVLLLLISPLLSKMMRGIH
ncbi:peptide MFS transporter [Limibacter armeniacum]|uniref:peptide MFS transporter n=1 Tax=Limibacter armeniacum TaxID=466084 RepID=UPI002FE5F5A7